MKTFAPTWRIAGTIILVLFELGLRGATGHRFTVRRHTPPDMFLAAAPAEGGVGVVFAESVEACVGGAGTARLLPLATERDRSEHALLHVPCARVRALAPAELAAALEGRGSRRGGGALPRIEKPISDRPRGFASFPGEWIPIQYFIRVNDDSIQLVRWSSGNHWGTEVEHSYQVVGSGGGRRIVTVRSVQRDVELD